MSTNVSTIADLFSQQRPTTKIIPPPPRKTIEECIDEMNKRYPCWVFVENSPTNMAIFLENINNLTNDDNETWNNYSVWKGQISPIMISLLRDANVKFFTTESGKYPTSDEPNNNGK